MITKLTTILSFGIMIIKISFFIAIVTVLIPPYLQAQGQEILAKIGNKKITMADFTRIIGYNTEEEQKVIESNPKLKETILWQIIRSTVIADIAKKKGFDKKPEIKRLQNEMTENFYSSQFVKHSVITLTNKKGETDIYSSIDKKEMKKQKAEIEKKLQFTVENFLASMFLQKEILEKITINEDQVRAYYQDHSEVFIRIKHILIKVDAPASDEKKKKAKAKAEVILGKIKKGEDFSKLASEVSDDPGTKDKGGDLGFFFKGTMAPALEEAAFSLKPGEVSEVVETENGFHIIKMEEKKNAHREP